MVAPMRDGGSHRFASSGSHDWLPNSPAAGPGAGKLFLTNFGMLLCLRLPLIPVTRAAISRFVESLSALRCAASRLLHKDLSTATTDCGFPKVLLLEVAKAEFSRHCVLPFMGPVGPPCSDACTQCYSNAAVASISPDHLSYLATKRLAVSMASIAGSGVPQSWGSFTINLGFCGGVRWGCCCHPGSPTAIFGSDRYCPCARKPLTGSGGLSRSEH